MQVSVVLYVHNGEKYLEALVSSILGQTHGQFELCIVDDGSTDRTPEVLARVADPDPRVRIERQDHLGSDRLHETVNNGLAMTSHDLIAIANADDIWRPQKLAVQAAAFSADPDLDICFHDATFIDHRDRVLHGSFRRIASPLPAAPPRPWQFIGGNPIPNPTTMFRRSILREIGMQELGQMHDTQFWFKATVHGCRFLGLADRLIHYRLHEESESTATHRRDRTARLHRDCATLMLERHGLDGLYPELAATPGDPDSRAWAWSHVAALFWKRSALDAAERAWAEALRLADNPALLGNMGAVALRQGNRRRARQLLSTAASGGYEHARVLLDEPGVVIDLLLDVWTGPAPRVADVVADLARGVVELPTRSRPPLPDAAVVIDAGEMDDGAQPSDIDCRVLAGRLIDIVDTRGHRPTALTVFATSDLALQGFVRAYEHLGAQARSAAEHLDIDLVQIQPDELAAIAAAHHLDGVEVTTLSRTPSAVSNSGAEPTTRTAVAVG